MHESEPLPKLNWTGEEGLGTGFDSGPSEGERKEDREEEGDVEEEEGGDGEEEEGEGGRGEGVGTGVSGVREKETTVGEGGLSTEVPVTGGLTD